MKWIDLTQGKRTCVDDDVFEWASKLDWFAHRAQNVWYAVRSGAGDERGKTFRLHRVILGLLPGEITCHLDGNGLNNTRANLKKDTQSQNLIGAATPVKNKTSRFRGVCFDTRRKKWIAQTNHRGKIFWFGYFDGEEIAARARDRGVVRVFGPGAQLNFPV